MSVVEGFEDELLGGDLVCLQAFAQRRGRDDELVLAQHGVAAGFL